MKIEIPQWVAVDGVDAVRKLKQRGAGFELMDADPLTCPRVISLGEYSKPNRDVNREGKKYEERRTI